MGGDDDDVQMEKKIEDVNIEEEEEEVYEGLLHAKAKGCLWFEQLQRFIPVQTLYSYAVPRIVCIGEESSGKSSTLERIAEMSFFPTDRHLCTRMPIELKLRHQDISEIKEKSGSPHASSYVMMHLIRGPGSKLSDDVNNGPFSTEDVASKVKEWMFSIVDGNSQDSGRPVGVTDDRLVIELYSTRKMSTSSFSSFVIFFVVIYP
jgi:GTPase SAR1 family protein